MARRFPVVDSRFEGLTNRSPLLAQILSQMERNSLYQPQSYGALAAGLGAQFLDQQTLKKELEAQQQAQSAQSQGLAQALAQYQQQSQGGMQSLPGTGVQLDTLPDPSGAHQGLMGSLVQNEHPLAQALAGQLMGQQFSPQASEGFTLSPGQTRYEGGQPVASLPESPNAKQPGIVTLSRGQDVISVRDNDPRIDSLLGDGWVERSTPLVQIGDEGPQFPSPPQGFYRPDQNAPGLQPEPGSPPPPERQMSGETKAKMGLLNASKESLIEAKSILYKDGALRRGLIKQLYNPLRRGPAADLYNSYREAMSNRLRAESGATITDQEIDDQTQRFLPKPWDDDETIKNKFVRFERFIEQYQGAISYEPEEQKSQEKPKGNIIRFDREGNEIR